MKLKIFLTILITFVFLSVVPKSFAANIEVMGKVDSFGSQVVFNDSATQEVVMTMQVDALGMYSASIPQGTYDVTIIPPSQSGISAITKYNQKFDSNAVDNFTLPSSASNYPTVQSSSENNDFMYIVLGIVGLVVVLALYIFWKKNK